MSIQSRRRFFLREKILDYLMLGFSLICIIGGFGMILLSSFWLQIKKPTPYLLNLIVILLGLIGFRNYQKEIE